MHASPIELEGMSLDALAGLQRQVEAELLRKHKARQSEALQQIARLAAEAELGVEDVIAHLEGRRRKGKRSSGTLPPRYRDPEDPSNTWAGRGKRPKWLEAKLAADATLEDFLITQPNEPGRRQAYAPGTTPPSTA
jgi:DNA-binding protein H-NS